MGVRKILKISKFILILFLFIIFSFFVFQYVRNLSFLSFDEIYNLQIPRSLNENFIYQNRYEPRQIHDVRISSGFPLHYLQLIYFKFFGESLESVRLLIFSLIIFLFIILFLILKNILIPFYLLSFFLVSSWFRVDLSRYYGELLASIFIILSFYFLKLRFKNKIFKRYYLYISTFLFSLSLSSKLIAFVVLPILLIFTDIKIRDVIKFLIYSICFYLLTNFLIIFYSYLLKFKTIDGFKTFMIDYFFNFRIFLLSNASKREINLLNIFEIIKNQYFFFEGGFLNFILFFILPQIILFFQGIKNKKIILVIIAFIFIYKIFLTMFWRHYLILLISIFFFSFYQLKKYNNKFYKIYKFLVIICFLLNTLKFFLGYNKIFSEEIKNSKKITQEQLKLAKKIDMINGDIITNGWWQLPEISFFTKKIFINRMSFDNINNKDNQYLFVASYQSSAWPQTDLEKICEEIILCEKNILICKFRKGIPFNLISDYPKKTDKCKKFNWD